MASGKLRMAVNCLVLLLPVVAAWIHHAASGILFLLAILGIWAWFAREQGIGFSRGEKAVMIAFAAILGMGLLSVPLHWISPDPFQSDFQYGHEFRLLLFAPVYFLFLHAKLKPETFWYGICAGAIFAGIQSLISFYLLGAGAPVEGAYHHIVTGDASMALAFMSLAGLQFFERRHKLMVFIPVAAALLGITAAFLTGARGALVAGPLLLLIFLVQIGSHPRAWTVRTAIVLVLVAAFLGGYFLPGSSMDARIRSGFKTVVQYLAGQEKSITASPDGSTAARLRMWKEAVEIIGNHPWIGVGDDGFGQIIRKKAESDPSLEPIAKYHTPHNMYLQFMTVHGIPGLPVILALFLAPLAVFIRWIRHDRGARDYAYAGVILVLAFMQFALTESLMEKSLPIAIYLVFTAAAMALCRTTNSNPVTSVAQN